MKGEQSAVGNNASIRWRLFANNQHSITGTEPQLPLLWQHQGPCHTVNLTFWLLRKTSQFPTSCVPGCSPDVFSEPVIFRRFKSTNQTIHLMVLWKEPPLTIHHGSSWIITYCFPPFSQHLYKFLHPQRLRFSSMVNCAPSCKVIYPSGIPSCTFSISTSRPIYYPLNINHH